MQNIVYFVSHYITPRLFSQAILIVEMLDNEPIDFDLIDNFEIIIDGSVFSFNKSNPLTINGTWGIGRITLAFYNLTTNPTSCDTEAIPTITATSSVCEGNLVSYLHTYKHTYMHTYIDTYTGCGP